MQSHVLITKNIIRSHHICPRVRRKSESLISPHNKLLLLVYLFVFCHLFLHSHVPCIVSPFNMHYSTPYVPNPFDMPNFSLYRKLITFDHLPIDAPDINRRKWLQFLSNLEQGVFLGLSIFPAFSNVSFHEFSKVAMPLDHDYLW